MSEVESGVCLVLRTGSVDAITRRMRAQNLLFSTVHGASISASAASPGSITGTPSVVSGCVMSGVVCGFQGI